MSVSQPEYVADRPAPGPRVAVVGAGLAGLACGRGLADRGFAVTVFDKGRGPGGRAATRRAGPDLAFDHGAQYFTVRDPDMAGVVAAWQARGVAAEWPGRIVTLDAGRATAAGPRPRYVGVPGMSAVGAAMAAGLDVRRDVRVTAVSRGGGGWDVAADSGEVYGGFDYLVVAVPAPQAAALLAPHPFAAAAAAVPMTPCWAALVAFDGPFDVPWDGAFVHNSAVAWAARNGSKPGRPGGADCWVLHATPDWSAAHLEDAADGVAPALVEAFAAAAGVPTPAPVYSAAHRWRYSQGADPADRRVLFDPAAGVAVCGDWLAGGRVEGALSSGTAAAGHISASVGRRAAEEL